MQNLFISPDDEFVVSFCVAMDKDDTIFCDLKKDSLISSLEAMRRNIDDFSIVEYSATFKRPSFGDTAELYGSIVMNDDGVSINPIEVRFRKLTALIKSWNLTGENKKPTEEEIRQLHPIIATSIGILVDLETGSIFN